MGYYTYFDLEVESNTDQDNSELIEALVNTYEEARCAIDDDGHGKELTDFLSNKLIVNGFSSDDVLAFNGMACLAASVVAHFKDGIGDIYLYPAKTRDCGEEYTYFVTGKIGEEANIEVIDTYEGNSLFNGKASDYENWISDLATE